MAWKTRNFWTSKIWTSTNSYKVRFTEEAQITEFFLGKGCKKCHAVFTSASLTWPMQPYPQPIVSSPDGIGSAINQLIKKVLSMTQTIPLLSSVRTIFFVKSDAGFGARGCLLPPPPSAAPPPVPCGTVSKGMAQTRFEITHKNPSQPTMSFVWAHFLKLMNDYWGKVD